MSDESTQARPAGLTEVYVVATQQDFAPAKEKLGEAFAADGITFDWIGAPDGPLFRVRAENAFVEVSFERREEPLGELPELLEGNPDARRQLGTALGFFRVAFEPGKPKGSVGVFEALWTVRTLLELVEGVVVDATAFKVHSPQDIEEITELDFDVRDHVSIHTSEMREGERDALWVHSHGLSKFGAPDVEMFHIREEDLPAADTFFQELCRDLAWGEGPALRAHVSTSVGAQFQLLPAEDARASLYGVDPELFEDHSGNWVTVVGADGRHSMNEILAQYRDRFEDETEEEAGALQDVATRLLPAFKARFARKGLMEPLTFLVRAPFEVRPDGEQGESTEEQLWVEVVAWEEKSLIGRLVDGGTLSTEWRRGAHVEIDDDQINAVSLAREGRALEPEEMERLLLAERPS